MHPYLAPLHLMKPTLPPHCEPANDFLYHLSATFRTCVPTNLALLSTTLGTVSIVSWLFAQLPQIYKNHKLKSTSGLSIYFLGEWLLGDLSNLLGSLFTHQALWQVILACYYVSVDCMLVGQWIWYELLKHGRPLRPALDRLPNSDSGLGGSGSVQVFEGVSIASPMDSPSISPAASFDKKDSKPIVRPGLDVPHRSNPMDVFRVPNFARSPGSIQESSSMRNSPPTSTTPKRSVLRPPNSSSPMPSPRTMIYISLLLALASHTTASPVSPFAPAPHPALRAPFTSSSTPTPSISEMVGTLLSWMSTVLYLGSRLPQLYKNHVRRSTAGLSPVLFVAAFFGNLFYSSSLLTNPCAWNSFAPGEGRGWVDYREGSDHADWVLRATPFFLGAAGVLVMDATMGLQFWYFGDGDAERGRSKSRARVEDVIVVVNDRAWHKKLRWRRVSGWMRGWVPSVSVAGSAVTTPAQTPRALSPSSSIGSRDGRGSFGSFRESGTRSGEALEEARALLGTQRGSSSPALSQSPRVRGYGGIS